jgi:hypothetical protein
VTLTAQPVQRWSSIQTHIDNIVQNILLQEWLYDNGNFRWFWCINFDCSFIKCSRGSTTCPHWGHLLLLHVCDLNKSVPWHLLSLSPFKFSQLTARTIQFLSSFITDRSMELSNVCTSHRGCFLEVIPMKVSLISTVESLNLSSRFSTEKGELGEEGVCV